MGRYDKASQRSREYHHTILSKEQSYQSRQCLQWRSRDLQIAERSDRNRLHNRSNFLTGNSNIQTSSCTSAPKSSPVLLLRTDTFRRYSPTLKHTSTHRHLPTEQFERCQNSHASPRVKVMAVSQNLILMPAPRRAKARVPPPTTSLR